MLPYFVFLFVALIIAQLAFAEKVRPFWLILLFIVMTLFAGLRSSSVGTDSGNYAYGFENQSYESKSLSSEIRDLILGEQGFTIIQKTIGRVSDKYSSLFLAIAAICFFPFLVSIKNNSLIPVVSIFAYITLGYYTFVFNGARQGIAVSFFLLSIPSLIKHNFWRYVLIVLAASLFHNSALIAIPLYFVFTQRYSFKTLTIVVLSGIAIGVFLPRLLAIGAIINEKIAGYGSGSTGGYILTVFYVLLTVFFVSQREYISSDCHYRYDVYLNMMIVGSVIYVIVSATGAYSELTRFAAYFQIASIFLWPEIMKNRIRPLSSLLLLLAFMGHLLYFYLSLGRFANLVPYQFNPNIFGS